MGKKLIKKCQVGAYMPWPNINQIQQEFAKKLSYTIKQPTLPTAPPSSVNPPPFSASTLNMSTISPLANIAGLIPQNPNSGYNTSNLTGGINQGYDMAANAAIQSGDPYAILAGTTMKIAGFGKDALDSLTSGKTTITNAATGVDKVLSSKLGFIAAPTLSLVNGLGKSTAKGTQKDLISQSGQYGYGAARNLGSMESGFFGKLFGGKSKLRQRKAAVKREEGKALTQMSNIYNVTQNQVASANSLQDITTKNDQALLGGTSINMLSAKKGGSLSPANLRNIIRKAEKGIKVSSLNVIPEGALHSRLNHLDGDIGEQVTNKGIPVISLEGGNAITQHAEIEANEIIFNKSTTDKIEDYFKLFKRAESDEEKNRIALECGQFLVKEILENVDDRTGLINSVE